MSPAIADCQSQQPQGQRAQLPTFQIPSPSCTPHCQGEIPSEATDSNAPNGFNCSNSASGLSRSRRKLKKVKKQVGSQNGVVRTMPFFTAPVTPVNNNITDVLLASFGGNSSGSVLKSNLGESVGQSSGGGEFGMFDNVGTSGSVGTAGPSVGGEFGKFDNMGFVFGVDKSYSALNVDSNKLQKNENVEKMGANFVKNIGDTDFVFGVNEKAEASKLGANEFGKFNSAGCAFGASKRDSVLTSNAENRDSGVTWNDCGVSNVGFMFGASKSDTVLNSSKENGLLGVGEGEFGFDNLGSEFVISNPEERESGGSVGKVGFDGSKFSDLKFCFPSNMFKSSSSLNLNTNAPNEKVETFIHERAKAEDDGGTEFTKFSNLDFLFSACHKDSRSDAHSRKEGVKENGGESVNVRGTEKLNTGVVSADFDDAVFVFTRNSDPSDGGNRKHAENWGTFDDACFRFGANSRDSTSSASMEKKEFTTSMENLHFAEGKKNVHFEAKFQGGNIAGVSQFRNGGDESSSLEGSRKLSDGMSNSNFNSEVDINMGSHLKSEFNFVFGSKNNLRGDYHKRPVLNISDEMERLHIHDHAKVNAADNIKDSKSYPGANTFNSHVFRSDDNTASSTGSLPNNSRDQRKDINKAGHGNGCAIQRKVLNGEVKSCGVFGKENQQINLNENSSDGTQIPENQRKSYTELNDDLFPSSSSSAGPSFLPKDSVSEAPPINRVEVINSCSFKSTPVGFEASFTSFSTPNLNMPHPFTANLVPDLNKNFEFSLNSSVGDKRSKKTRGKLRQQILFRQRAARANSSKEGKSQQNQESPGCCSPMDFSPYQDTNYEPSSTHSTVLTKENDENSCDGKSQFSFPSSSTNFEEGNFKFSASSFAQGEVSSTKPRSRKKYKMRICRSVNGTTSSQKLNLSNDQSTGEDISKADGKHSRQRTDAIQEACQKWRIRGNQAYKDGDLLKAETCYTKGIDSIPKNKTSGFCSESLVLCYSNRAATRMSLGRVREALGDCKVAAALDPTFTKVHLRAANCHLALGEVKEALYNYKNCLETGTMVCLDRKLTIEAADGLQKAQNVVNCTNQSAELLQQRTFGAAAEALGVIAEALAISCYSEKLLELKGEALFLLRKYEDVVQLCEQTLAFAEKNFTPVCVANPLINVDGFDSRNSLKLWRWDLLSRSYFRLGRLERVLDLIERQEQQTSVEDNYGGRSHESSSPLAATIRELLHCKNAGNEAFKSGRHTEAIEHYTTTMSKSVESRPFAAVCICNRAAAHQALGELIDAIADCSLAIALDGSYSKALSRRATLHEMIRDYDEAANDLRKLISVLEKQSNEKSQQSGTPDRSTGGIVKDLRRARRRLSTLEEKAKKGMPLDFYLILGLKATDASSDVKKAYRKAALRHHPDKAGQFLVRSESGDDEQPWKEVVETIRMDADRLFKMIGEANAVLSDSTKRSKYDLDEEMRRDDQENTGSSGLGTGRRSKFYSSPFESSNRGSQESRKANTSYHSWREDRWKGWAD